MKVRAIETSVDNHITEGKEYDVIESVCDLNWRYYRITGDKDIEIDVFQSRFEIIPEQGETMDKCLETAFDPVNINYRYDQPTTKLPSGVKYDTGKLQYSLIEPAFLKEIATVLTKGAEKYAPENWKKVDDAKKRYTDAMIRHIEAWRSGEEHDPEMNTHHLANAATNAMFLMWIDGVTKLNPNKENN